MLSSDFRMSYLVIHRNIIIKETMCIYAEIDVSTFNDIGGNFKWFRWFILTNQAEMSKQIKSILL